MATAVEYLMVSQPAQLEELYRTHQATVLKAAYRITGSISDAEDVSQSVFLRLADGRVDPDRISNLQGYLRRSAVNAALDLLRSRGHRKHLPVEAADQMQDSSTVSPERALTSKQIREWLRRELLTLSPRAAEIFTLRYLEELNPPEIARMMKTTEAVVAVTLFRTRARLKGGLRRFMKGSL